MKDLPTRSGRSLPALLILVCLFFCAPAAGADVVDDFAWVLGQLDQLHANPFPVTGADVGGSKHLFQCLDNASNDVLVIGCLDTFKDTAVGKKAMGAAGIPSWFWDFLDAYVDLRTHDYGGAVAKLGEAAICIVAQIMTGGTIDVCGLLKELVQVGEDVVAAGKALWYGAGGVLGLNDPKAISQESYYALAWEPWYHTGTWMCLTAGCPGLGNLESKIWHACKDYFASHDMTESTAQSACDVMRDNKFSPKVHALAKTMPLAAAASVETMRPLAKMWAVDDYGNDKALGQNKATFVQGCVNSLMKTFPFPTPDPGKCNAIKQSPMYSNALFKPLLDKEYSQCLTDVAQQLPSPTAWQRACDAVVPKFMAVLGQEKAAVDQEIATLVKAGCFPPLGWTATQGLKLECDNYAGYQACLSGMSAGTEKKICSVNQQKADEKLAKAIVAQLGSKRCSAVGSEVHCTRPWKEENCTTLRAQLSGGADTKVQCKGGPAAAVAAFAVLTENAKDIVNSLSGMRVKNAAPFACKRPTFDPLTIDCHADQALVPHIKALKLGYCPADPNKDGADTPCLLMTMGWQNVVLAEKGVLAVPPKLPNPSPPPKR